MKNLIKGLEILAKYSTGNVAAEHDVIYAGPEDEIVSQDDAKELETLGWHLDEEVDSWAYFT